ncbi:E3 ubiquitin-protein ligase Mdm2-like [Neodiprion pinetum]|uniref:E3 ubiquitin-protein ligase Mdm2 n=1 Tax=Neodiprion lecontei TaxID=441921 RepID=A0A6J0BWA2_NEOLC|nr:E3 ubiquitin-protein ligase Mdm2 [Neodiprion lecontei]XP_046417143.1 E3 ubiquitin-protein ligase Mdm2-like [Neodiprion fabricii]XP_046471157.1 E3 ubiquitin-protein ligase Mdm2-like [Neodiprion pinetum]
MSLVNLSVNTQPPGLLRGSWLKRCPDSENEDDNGEGIPSKVPRYSWYVTLESESPQPTDEDDESVYSVQDKETDYVTDTSDTSTHTWVSSTDGGDLALHVEYEVASLSEDPNPFDNNTSSSDVSDIVAMGVLTFCDSDLGLADDSNDSRSSVDSEIGTADYWTCVQCNTKNNNPLFRYCEKCYQIRKNFFPPRPKWRKSRRQLQSCKDSLNKNLSEQGSFKQELSSVDSGLGSSQDGKCSPMLDVELDETTIPSKTCVTSSSSLPMSPSKLGQSGDTADSGFKIDRPAAVDTCPSSISQDILNESEYTTGSMLVNNGNNDRPNDETVNRNIPWMMNRDPKYRDKIIVETHSTLGETESKLCITCTAAPKNGAFVHGAVTHICCCYRCAVKVWSKTKRCPICNRKVTNVLKAFYT